MLEVLNGHILVNPGSLMVTNGLDSIAYMEYLVDMTDDLESKENKWDLLGLEGAGRG